MQSTENIYFPRYRWFKYLRNVSHKNRPWYSRSPLLNYLVQWLITFDCYFPQFGNNGKFKAGDIVVYNWKAKVQIYSAIEPEKLMVVSRHLYKNKENVEFSDGNSCGCFWVRKATAKERKNIAI